MGFLLTFIASLGTSYILTKIIDSENSSLYNKVKNGLALSENDAKALLNEIISQVQKKGSKEIDVFNRKLESFISLNPAASSALKSYRITAKHKAQKRYDDAKQKYDDKINNLSVIEKSLSDYSYSPDTYKASKGGQDELKDISQKIVSEGKQYSKDYSDKTLNDKITKVEQSIKNVEDNQNKQQDVANLNWKNRLGHQ